MLETKLAEKTPTQLTPMMMQYLSIKREHEEYLLLFRMGDFFELFFDDATTAAPVLEVVLTSRGKHLADEIPMCGVPAHACDLYVAKLIKAGYKVAICEQMESPEEAKKRGPKSVVRREVTRIITPGTVMEEGLVSPGMAHNIISIHLASKPYLAICDITTGHTHTLETNWPSLISDICRFEPKEIIIADKSYSDQKLKEALANFKQILSFRPDAVYTKNKAHALIERCFGASAPTAISKISEAETIAFAAVLEYVEHTLKGNLPKILAPQRLESTKFMEIDHSTARNLELFYSTSGSTKNSLFDAINVTRTALGSRLLAFWLAHPLIGKHAIDARLNALNCFCNNKPFGAATRTLMAGIPDFERLLVKISANRANFFDAAQVLKGLQQTHKIADLLQQHLPELSENIRIILSQISNFGDVTEFLETAINADGTGLDPANYIMPGFMPQLDELYALRQNAGFAVDEMREKYKNETGIANLKITQNMMLGYFIEVSSSHLGKVPAHFILRQSMVNSSRFTTNELKELENKINNAEGEIAQLLEQYFAQVARKIMDYAETIFLAANALAQLDIFQSAAELAHKHNFCKPEIDETTDLQIEKGRHPIVEKNSSSFIPNDLSMGEDAKLWLITGPNMAGKSTFLRQNALIIILAQIGFFVPAKSARIGIVNKLFSRIGASDDIARGQSTFMVEMVETANILNNATERSFLRLDEIGRGTSTQDGLAIARAILENIHDKIKARTLFATHYHELPQIYSKWSRLKCYTMRVKEHNDKIIFTHEIQEGAADSSYGVHVAELAGIPQSVIKRAKELNGAPELPLFNAPRAEPANNNSQARSESEVEKMLKSTDVDDLTPRSALELLYKLKGKL